MSVSAEKYTGGSIALRILATAAIAATYLVGAHASAPGPAWRAAPGYAALFTAETLHPGAYEAYTSAQSLDAVLRDTALPFTLLRAPGAWEPQEVIALDAFGRQGAYNRWALARLYGARRARVARGPVGAGGGVTESWTLISPYPDVTLQHLLPGTLLIVLHLP